MKSLITISIVTIFSINLFSCSNADVVKELKLEIETLKLNCLVKDSIILAQSISIDNAALHNQAAIERDSIQEAIIANDKAIIANFEKYQKGVESIFQKN